MARRTSTASRNSPEMGRPRSFTDEAAFQATSHLLTTRGASELTLAAIAREVGCTGQALNARFGTRHGLLMAYVEWSAIRQLALFNRVRGDGLSPLQALRQRFAIPSEERAEELDGAGSQILRLSLLGEARFDPELKRVHKEQMDEFVWELAKLIEEAVSAGELADTIDAEATSRLIVYATTGSSVFWFIEEKGTIEADVLKVVDQILQPFMRTEQGATHDRSGDG